MANFNDIKHEIDQNVNTNGVQAITGAILNETLKDMIDEVDEKKQDTLVAGQNITIQGNVISASGGGSGEEYYAGHGIAIDENNIISADFNFVQEKLVDGQNIKSVNGEPILGSGDIDIPEYVEGNGIDITSLGNVNQISVDPSDLAGNGLQDDGNGHLMINTSVVQGKLTAGANIQISGNTISATDTNTTYSAGSGLNLNGTTFSVKAGSGLSFDANGNLINTGGGGGGTTYIAGDGVEIDQNNVISAKTGPGLLVDPSTNNIELDRSALNFLPLEGGQLQATNAGDDTTLTVMDGMDEDYVRIVAPESQGAPHVEIFENGSGETKFFYDHIERGSQVSIDLPSQSGTIALTSDIPTVPTASSLAGNGLQDDGNGALEIDTTVVATQSDLSDYLPLTGGTLNNTGQINTNLSVQSPNSDYHVNTYVPNSGSVEIEIGMSSGHAVQNPSDGDTKNLRVYKDKVDLYTYDSGTSNWRADSLYFPKKKTGTIALDSDLAGKQDTLVSGTNIKTINGNSLLGSGDITISGGQSYTAGNGIDITSGTISVDASDLDGTGLTTTLGGELAVDTTVIQEKLTAGTGISISAQNVISATGGGGTTYTAGTGISIDANNQISAKIANGYGLGTNLNGELLVDAGALAGNGLQVDQNGQLEVVGGGGGSGLWTSGTGTDSLLSIPAQNSNGTAAGDYALSAGWYTTASADNSVALGNQTTASRTNAFAAGKQSTASGISSVALGDVAAASGDYSVALGSLATASGTRSFATSNATASNTNAVALGDGADATALLSTAIGTSAKATNTSEIALGKWNKSTSTGTDADKTQFSIGNGTAVGSESNIIEAKKNNDVYLYGVGGFTGANYSNAQTLQDVINNAGGGGNYLPLDGGSLRDTTQGSTQTALGVYSPQSGASVSLTADSPDPGTVQDAQACVGIYGDVNGTDKSVEFYNDRMVVDGGNYSISYPTVSADDTLAVQSDLAGKQNTLVSGTNIKTVNGNSLLGSGDLVISGGQSYSAGNGIDITNNTISVDNTIATVSDLQGYLPLTGGNLRADSGQQNNTSLYLETPDASTCVAELTASNDTNNGETECRLSLDSGNGSFAELGAYGDGTDKYAYLTLSRASDTIGDVINVDIDSSGTILVDANVDDGQGTATAEQYTLELPKKSGTIATLSDIPSASSLAGDGLQDDGNGALEVKLGSGLQLDANGAIETTGGGGGTSYTAGTGISISAQNVISNTAPDPGLWVAGNGTNAIRTSTSSSGSANGLNSIAIGDNTEADGGYSMALGSRSKVYGSNLYATAIAGGQVGTYGSNGYQNAVAIGYSAYCTAADTIALGVGTRSFNQGEASIGYYANAITGGTTAENTRFTVGNGTSGSSRSNLIEAKQNNDLYIYGVGGFTGTNASAASTLQTVLSGKQDQLTAGSGISIQNNVISATGGGGGGSLWTSGTGTDSLVAPGTVSSSLSQDPASGNGAISCGYDTNADGDFAFAQGGTSSASGDYSFAANNGNAAGDYSASFGSSGANGYMSFAAGNGATANAARSIALGNSATTIYDDSDPNAIINAEDSVAIGNGAITNNRNAISIGTSAMANGIDSVAIGVNSYANAQEAYAIGSSSTSEGLGSVAFSGSTASGDYSMSMPGGDSIGDYSIAGGLGAIASIYSSIALGLNTMTYDQNNPSNNEDPQAGETALGRYNYTDRNFIFSVGCGKEVEHDPNDPDWIPNPDDPESQDPWTEIIRENAITITTDGSIYIKGLGQYTGTQISGATSLQSLISNL